MRKERQGSLNWLTPEGIVTALGMMWLALFPFWQDGSYSHITRTKWIGMLILTGVTVAGAACALLLRLRQGKKLRLGWPQAAGLTYFALVALSAVFGSWADHTGESGRLTVLWGAYRYEGLYTQLCYGAVLMCMSVARVRLRPLLHAASLGLLAYGAFVALQYAGVNVLGLFPMGTSIRTNYEFQGPIGNIDMVVGYVALMMAAALGGFVWLKRPHPLWIAAGVTGAGLLLMTQVQCGLIALIALLFMLLMLALLRPEARWRAALVLAGVLAMVTLRLVLALPWLDGTQEITLRTDLWRMPPLAAGLALAALAAVLRRWPGSALRAGEAATLGGGLIFLAVLAVYMLPIPEGNGLWELQEMLHGRVQDAFGSERIGIWRLTLEMCRGNLLWGTGPDAFLHAMDQHLWQTGQALVQRFDNPHNLFLAVLAGSGLPALGVYIALTVGAPGHALLHARRDEEPVPLALAALCYLAQGMFTFSICLVTPMFWAVLGMLAGKMNERNGSI
ncbi:MAG: O-antigen ligase family protein [Clostridia bacterium]|nr:O-antigen ligase family protein [Clostridia bacterium]